MRVYNHIDDQVTGPLYGAINDWEALGSVLHMPTNIMSWTLRQRDSMQHRIRLGDRVVYKSDPYLQAVQQRIAMLIAPLMDNLQDNDVVLSYRSGVSTQSELSKYANSKMCISFDIRKYYDHVRLPHIEEALHAVGFSREGARLIGRYCIVKRGNIHSLQQGCTASPAISNLVGYFNFDRPILAWLRYQYPNLNYKYVRYCDNVALFLFEPEPEGFREAYKTAVNNRCVRRGFRTHDWASISHTHPKRNIKFLGVVLNAMPRIERAKFDDLRATLYNMSAFGISNESERFCGEYAPVGAYVLEPKKILQILRGHAAYVASINKRHGLWCRKILDAMMITNYGSLNANVEEYRSFAERYACDKRVSDAIMKYRDDSESIDEYLNRIVCVANEVLAEYRAAQKSYPIIR